MKRKKLAELGFVSDFDKLDDRIADGFNIISSKIDSISREDMKRGKK